MSGVALQQQGVWWKRAWPVYPVVVFLAVFFLIPIGTLLGLSALDQDGSLTTEHYARLWSNAVYVKVLLVTLKIASWTTLFALLGAYPVAYLLATLPPTTRNAMIVWVLMPMWTSFLVRAFSWMVLLGRKGVLNELLLTLGVIDMPLRMIYNFTGVLVGTVHAMLPLCVMVMLPVMQGIDGNLVKAASTLGARKGQAFWRVYFPLSLPGVAAGGLLVFITTLGFFITPALLGGADDAMIVQLIIFQINQMLNWSFAGAIAVLFLLTTLVIFYVYDQFLGLSSLSGSMDTRPKGWLSRWGSWLGGVVLTVLAAVCSAFGALYDRVVPRSGAKARAEFSRATLWFCVLLVLAFLCVPALFLVPVSFTEDGFMAWPPRGFSWQWYESVLKSDLWLMATARSFIIAVLAASLGTLIGVPAAFFMSRQRFAAKGALLAFILAPIIIPNIIVAVALFYLFSKLGLVGTMTGMVIGHTVLTIPYIVITVMSILKTYDVRLDHAAWTLGANKLRTLIHITLPIIQAGIIAAFMFAFIISFDELTIALFITGGEVTTLPKLMWDGALLKVSPALAAVASLLLLFMTAFILISEYVRRRARRVL